MVNSFFVKETILPPLSPHIVEGEKATKFFP